ncbi:Clp protease N-terminal domain-containing protein [Kitasatospora arboriphila]
MFERFTDGARRVVMQAQVEARELGHEKVGTEHLLLGIVHDPADPVAALLAADGLDHEAARAEVVRLSGGHVDGRALAAIGVDLDAVRAAVESAFGEGALERRPPRAAGQASTVGSPRAPARPWSSRCARPSASSRRRSPPATSCSA